jgi:GNAT superfamily N-acetyltransferase
MSSQMGPEYTLREQPRAQDRLALRTLVAETGFFSGEEVAIAEELLVETLRRGAGASGYHFLLADCPGALAGYSCFGPIPGTRSSWDLYWIVVARASQGRGLGRRLLAATETAVAAAGGTRVYAETSSRPQYAPTRAFYAACGYQEAARLTDFYAPGDGKVIYCRAQQEAHSP